MGSGLNVTATPSERDLADANRRWRAARRTADLCDWLPPNNAAVCRDRQQRRANAAYADFIRVWAAHRAALDEVNDWFDAQGAPAAPRKAMIDPAPRRPRTKRTPRTAHKRATRMRRLLAWLRGPWIADDPTKGMFD